MWKCKINPGFVEKVLLRKFLLNEIPIIYDDSIKMDEAVIVREYEKRFYIKKQLWETIFPIFMNVKIN